MQEDRRNRERAEETFCYLKASPHRTDSRFEALRSSVCVLCVSATLDGLLRKAQACVLFTHRLLKSGKRVAGHFVRDTVHRLHDTRSTWDREKKRDIMPICVGRHSGSACRAGLLTGRVCMVCLCCAQISLSLYSISLSSHRETDERAKLFKPSPTASQVWLHVRCIGCIGPHKHLYIATHTPIHIQTQRERPYQCDYPGCKRAFTQSGQLKTHQRLHTGERPFICSVAHCQMRFTHANRHCPDHPLETLKRCDDFVIQALPEQNTEVLKWLEKYRAEREDRTPTRKTPIKRTNSPDGVGSGPENGNGAASSATQNENENRRQDTAQRSATNNENHLPLGVNGSGNGLSGGVSTGNGALGNNHQLLASPVTPNNTYKSIRKGLMDMNACMGLTSPVTTKAKNSLPKLIQWQEPTSQEENESGDECCVPSKQSTFNPKKKWLRDAWQEDLAKPLEPNLISPKLFASTTSTMALKQQLHQESVVTISPSKRQLLGVIGHNKPLPRMEGIGHSTSAPAPVVTSVAPPPPAPFNPNQTRPTVLMVASKDSARPLSVKPAAELLANEITANGTCLSPKPEENNRKLQGALALMQLAAKDAFLQDAYEVPSVPEALLAHGTTLLCGRSPVEATNNGSTLAVNGFTTTEATVQEKCP
ncbi:uncharacterized protein LOC120900585 isoform X1 [Anopheles arabiensis]|uniref:uncharacterized protein LOC120900585 isoform X1 n=1 Tax=Anopheles arabiensis TaxID=7173 RepID=UPI001AADB885|nr:uncharacterized protein LOC120900585 isoform X1 [Anopheles arabiensis]XP_040163690.1 uncharacterized protein LOC120900585 isoform X1 [Anopheles arabiensis]